MCIRCGTPKAKEMEQTEKMASQNVAVVSRRAGELYWSMWDEGTRVNTIHCGTSKEVEQVPVCTYR
jgi:hypothetical protein